MGKKKPKTLEDSPGELGPPEKEETVPEGAEKVLAEATGADEKPEGEGEADPAPKKKGRPKLSAEERAARKAARDAEEAGMEPPRTYARRMMRRAWQASSFVLFSKSDAFLVDLKKKAPKVTTLPEEVQVGIASLPDSLALDDAEADDLAKPTEGCIDKYFPGLLDRIGPEVVLAVTLADIVVARYQLIGVIQHLAEVVQEAQKREPKPVTSKAPETGDAPPV